MTGEFQTPEDRAQVLDGLRQFRRHFAEDQRIAKRDAEGVALIHGPELEQLAEMRGQIIGAQTDAVRAIPGGAVVVDFGFEDQKRQIHFIEVGTGHILLRRAEKRQLRVNREADLARGTSPQREQGFVDWIREIIARRRIAANLRDDRDAGAQRIGADVPDTIE